MHSRQNPSNVSRLRPLRELALLTDAIIISWQNAVKQKADGTGARCIALLRSGEDGRKNSGQ